jgi:hypothetical protein
VKVGTLNTHGVCAISLQAAVHPLMGPHTNKQTNVPLKYFKLYRENTVNVENIQRVIFSAAQLYILLDSHVLYTAFYDFQP